MILLTFPFNEEQAQAVIVAADRFGVEPWEMAVHALMAKGYFKTGKWQF